MSGTFGYSRLNSLMTQARMRKETYGRKRGCNDFVTAFNSLSLATTNDTPKSPVTAFSGEGDHARDSTDPTADLHGDRRRDQDGDTKASLVKGSRITSLEAQNQQQRRRIDKSGTKASKLARHGGVKEASAVLQEQSHNMGTRIPTIEHRAKQGKKAEAGQRAATEPSWDLRHSRRTPGGNANSGSPVQRHRGRPKRDRTTPSVVNEEPTLPRGLAPLQTIIQSTKKVSRFSDFYADVSNQFTLRKINQGSYGSVYSSTLHDDQRSQTVWKVMPLRRDNEKRQQEDWRTRFKDLIAEAKLLLALSGIDGFVQMREVHLTQGMIPDGLKALDEAWFQSIPQHKREEIDQTFEQMDWNESQWWCWFEMSYAGLDLENWLDDRRHARNIGYSHTKSSESLIYGAVSILEAWDIFWSVTETLGCAELDLEFEHRDLHSGNVCIRECDRQTQSHGSARDTEGMGIKRMANLEATLIDYSISRARIPTTQSANEEIIAIAPEDIFDQEAPSGDNEAEHQYLIYDTMLEITLNSHPTAQRRKTGWQSFMPKTNLLWLEHLLRLLLLETDEYDTHDWTIRERERSTDEDEAVETLLLVLESLEPDKWAMWGFESASQLVENQLLVQQESNAEE